MVIRRFEPEVPFGLALGYRQFGLPSDATEFIDILMSLLETSLLRMPSDAFREDRLSGSKRAPPSSRTS